MLTARSETPRPRPPAKARRSTSTNQRLRPSASSPPPSYTDSFGGGRSLPHSTTEEVLSSRIGKVDIMNSDDLWGLRAAKDDQRYSHEVMDNEDDGPPGWGEPLPELASETLDEAHDIFREREHDEGGGTSVAGRTSYGDATALRGAHQTHSVPFQQTESPQEITSPLPTLPPLFSTPTRGYYTYSHSTPERLSDLSRSNLGQRPSQRLSMSAADVAYLADQNAELLDKLEKLEHESSHADQFGRRHLKRLEKEIAELREELEKTQARSEELEEKTKRGWNSEQVINAVARKKLEREAKMKALRNLGQSSEETEVRSFAPEGSRFGGPSPGLSFMTPGRRSNSSVPFPGSDDADARSVSSPFPSKGAPQQELSTDLPADRPEIALINKLMDKMTELQEANARIIEQQAETTKQLQAFQNETKEMGKIYHSLGTPFEVEDASDSDDDRTGLTRFHSFSQLVENRTLRSASAKKRYGPGRNRRRTLGSTDTKAARAVAVESTASTNKIYLPVPFPPSPNVGRHHSCSSLHEAFASPALSLLSLDAATEELRQPSPLLPTLQSELGNALNVEHGDGNNFHLRSTSIFDLSAKLPSIISIPPSPSPSPGNLQAYRTPAEVMLNVEDTQAPPTPTSLGPRGNSLLLHPEGAVNEVPATPAMDNHPTLELTSPGLQSPRYYRMSQTVRSRTDRWVKGRFSYSLVGAPEYIPEPQQEASPASLGVSQRLAQAFESVVEGLASPGTEAAMTAEEGANSPAQSSGRTSVASLYEDATPGIASPQSVASREKQGFGKAMLELWLWLQFVVVILVFLWAMARKGPKAVLFESDGKRAPGRR